MSTILGVFSPIKASIPSGWIDEMIETSQHWPYDRKGISDRAAFTLACLQHFNTPQACLARQPYGNDSVEIVFDGRLDNREELARELGLGITQITTDEQLILKAFLKYGASLGEYLLGDFVIAALDKKNHQLFLIRDHMGVRPLFIAQNEIYFAFASNKKALLSLPWVSDVINKQWLADYLAITKVENSNTFYKQIETLPPAHWLRIEKNSVKKYKYWQLDANSEIHYDSDSEYVEQFKKILYKAIECRLRTYGGVASELSGGLDSTAIVSIASKLLEKYDETIHAFSHVLPPENEDKFYPYHDEKKYIAKLVNSFENITHYPVYSRGRGILQAMNYSIKIHAGPVRNDLSQLSDEAFETLKQKEIRTLLSGFGGDQLVTSHGVGWLDELSQQGLYQAWQQLEYFSQNNRQRLGHFLSLIKHKISSAQQNMSAHVLQVMWDERLLKTGISPEFASKFGYPQRYFDHPTRPIKVKSIRDHEFKIIHSPHIVYRLEDSALGASSYGIDYRYPLLDIRLLQYCLSLPSRQKVQGGMNRRMMRMATLGLLPDMIRLRNDKSRATVPTLQQRFFKDRLLLEKLTQNILSYPLTRDCLNPALLYEFLSGVEDRLNSDFTLSNKAFLRQISLVLWLSKNSGHFNLGAEYE